MSSKSSSSQMEAVLRRLARKRWLTRPKAKPLVNVYKIGLSDNKTRPYALAGSGGIDDVGNRHVRVAHVSTSRSKYTPTGKRSR